MDDYGSKWDGSQVSASYVLVGSEVEKFMSALLVVQRTKINTVDGCGEVENCLVLICCGLVRRFQMGLNNVFIVNWLVVYALAI